MYPPGVVFRIQTLLPPRYHSGLIDLRSLRKSTCPLVTEKEKATEEEACDEAEECDSDFDE